jgi:hypothetical protein
VAKSRDHETGLGGEGIDHLEDLGTDGKIILKWVLMAGRGMD